MLMSATHTQDQQNIDEAQQLNLQPGMRIHLVGIAGSGMSAIAWLLLGRGFAVSGSDLHQNDLVTALREAGAVVHVKHHAKNVSDAELVVISSAVPPQNVEVVAALEAGIPVLKRADLLGYLMTGAVGIAVAGTHGKTTTTSMIAHILLEAGRDPSLVAGGILPGLGRNGRAGESDLFVVEADEYDYMFLGLRPQIELVTNLEHDHPDLFDTPAAYLSAFMKFVDRLPPDGTLICCHDDEGARQLLAENQRGDIQVMTYGTGEAPDGFHFRAVDLQPNQLGGTDFVVLYNGDTLGLARLRLPGEHNVRNALAAIAACNALGVAFTEIVQALISFGGVERRFQLVGEIRDVTVIDDYAHHPTEIRATLAAARQRFRGRRLWAVWQPHTYSRTRLLGREFARSFGDADRVIVLDIYRSREKDTLGVNAAQIVAEMDHPYARHIGLKEEAAKFILDRVLPGDLVLTLGAGDGDEVGKWILDGLRRRVQANP